MSTPSIKTLSQITDRPEELRRILKMTQFNLLKSSRVTYNYLHQFKLRRSSKLLGGKPCTVPKSNPPVQWIDTGNPTELALIFIPPRWCVGRPANIAWDDKQKVYVLRRDK